MRGAAGEEDAGLGADFLVAGLGFTCLREVLFDGVEEFVGALFVLREHRVEDPGLDLRGEARCMGLPGDGGAQPVEFLGRAHCLAYSEPAVAEGAGDSGVADGLSGSR